MIYFVYVYLFYHMIKNFRVDTISKKKKCSLTYSPPTPNRLSSKQPRRQRFQSG